MAFDYDVPIDEYDLDYAGGGFFSAIGGAIKGAVKGFVGSGFNPLGAIGGAIGGALGGDDEEAMAAAPPPVAGYPLPRQMQLTVPQTRCVPGTVWDPVAQICVSPGSPGDISVGGPVVMGQAVMGRFGAALTPETMPNVRRRCLPGMVLGRDNLCYEKRNLRKDERKWNPGRKPLFTGGDLNAITRAHRLEKQAAGIARKLGYNVRTKAAAARDAERKKRRGRGRARGAPQVDIDIDTD